MIMDLHTHSHHSPDASNDTVSSRIDVAAAIGLQIMAITDHIEINRWFRASHYRTIESDMYYYNSEGVFSGSVSETDAAKPYAQSKGVLLLAGAEVGQIPQDPERARSCYLDPRLDMVIGSVHELPNTPDFYFLDYNDYSADDIQELMDAYFQEVLRTAQSDCYDVLGHLTYGLRYLPNRHAYDLTPHIPVIDAILKTVIEKGKALELNGRQLRNQPPATDPDLDIIRRYRKMGGKYLTIGTDAHDSQYLGHQTDVLEQMARAAGFSELTYFVQHQPTMISL